jgi:hypothetical protein
MAQCLRAGEASRVPYRDNPVWRGLPRVGSEERTGRGTFMQKVLDGI